MAEHEVMIAQTDGRNLLGIVSGKKVKQPREGRKNNLSKTTSPVGKVRTIKQQGLNNRLILISIIISN